MIQKNRLITIQRSAKASKTVRDTQKKQSKRKNRGEKPSKKMQIVAKKQANANNEAKPSKPKCGEKSKNNVRTERLRQQKRFAA